MMLHATNARLFIYDFRAKLLAIAIAEILLWPVLSNVVVRLEAVAALKARGRVTCGQLCNKQQQQPQP